MYIIGNIVFIRCVFHKISSFKSISSYTFYFHEKTAVRILVMFFGKSDTIDYRRRGWGGGVKTKLRVPRMPCGGISVTMLMFSRLFDRSLESATRLKSTLPSGHTAYIAIDL